MLPTVLFEITQTLQQYRRSLGTEVACIARQQKIVHGGTRTRQPHGVPAAERDVDPVFNDEAVIEHLPKVSIEKILVIVERPDTEAGRMVQSHIWSHLAEVQEHIQICNSYPFNISWIEFYITVNRSSTALKDLRMLPPRGERHGGKGLWFHEATLK